MGMRRKGKEWRKHQRVEKHGRRKMSRRKCRNGR